MNAGSGDRAARRALGPLLISLVCVAIFSGGVWPAVREARALAQRRDELRRENAQLEERLRLLRGERSALLTDPFLNERLRRREFHAGPEEAPR